MLDSKEVDAKTESETTTSGQTPLPIKTSRGRKYIRVELSSPIQFRLLTCNKGKIKLSKDRTSGEILNLSEGGVLLLVDRPLPEDVFLLLTLNLNQLVILEGVLGKIKRVEPSEEGDFHVGVEFTSREELEKLASLEQIDHLPVKVASFGRKLREIIFSYLRTAELATR